MSYAVTFEGRKPLLVDDVAQRHFLRQALRRGDEVTKVRSGYVVSLPGGALVALLAVGA